MKTRETKQSIEAFNKYLVEGVDSKWKKDNTWRKVNKGWLKKSAKIALKVNRYLKENKITQKKLAVAMDVTPQAINKLLKGRENLTLESIVKLESVLGIELISTLNADEIIVKKKEMDSFEFIKSIVEKFEFSRDQVIKPPKKSYEKLGDKIISGEEILRGSYTTVSVRRKIGESNYAMAA
ncbi:helix-turn-helix domain-containing protein [Fulvivirga sp. RKSG066]|uniref:helix-turn-helix transcriptional regulator n=1 Tax=Fulvivirga aurantia TaxID=2529383 RepID=UPI0012BCAE0F|nr:helix-turn-helix domain-containing protein [Fulvivirga aurantia]MTI20771.1 helix-turn-helix domain-containing protein [Fulvivirga aurantia]